MTGSIFHKNSLVIDATPVLESTLNGWQIGNPLDLATYVLNFQMWATVIKLSICVSITNDRTNVVLLVPITCWNSFWKSAFMFSMIACSDVCARYLYGPTSNSSYDESTSLKF
ncbi:MAG TPA: hypothetical protein PLD02_16835 [Saprospiraceae bacterium]|nr:hypothetical protein [Saprospiraceae bacterium]